MSRFLLLTVLLAGCASVHSERLTTDSIIVFKRNLGFSGFEGVDCKTKIIVNNQSIASLSPGDILKLEIPAGRNYIRAVPDTGPCPRFEATKVVVLKTNSILQLMVEKE